MTNARESGEFTYDLNNNLLFKKDGANYINALGIDQLKTIGNIYLLDIFLNKDNCVELHYHPNASELIYCISGEAELSFINMDTNAWQTFQIERGEVVSIPEGWWHYVCARKDHTHLLAIFDTNQLETIFGSDLLRLTPDEVFAHLYCLEEEEVQRALRPIDETIIIGPPADCQRSDQTQRVQKNKNSKVEEIRSQEHGVDIENRIKKDQKNREETGEQVNHSKEVQPVIEMNNQQLEPFYAGYHYVHPLNICQACLGYW